MLRRNWTREELTVAFNLYCKIPFGRIHNRNPLIIELSKAIGRSPSALSWKLANFARLDPALQKRNIAGAVHGGQGEIEIWNEFNNNWSKLAFESERLLSRMTKGNMEISQLGQDFPTGIARDTTVRARVNQGFFRAAVLAAYDLRCCITGLSVPQLLIASHIVPWSIDAANRTNPRNGLCLNALHDRAFDSGLLTVTPTFKVRVSRTLRGKNKSDVSLGRFLLRYEGVPISLPERFAPDVEFLRYHNEEVFLNS
ncbi:MAG: HNH endonuclease signature motif containing protein [Candidatus Acidiferrales bacterium]